MIDVLKKLFGRKKEISTEIPTSPLQGDGQVESIVSPALTSKSIPVDLPQLDVACAQSAGKQRDHNEDALFTLTTNLAGDTRNLPLGLYIIADGMGGYKQGEVASELAVRTFGNLVIQRIILSLLGQNPKPPDDPLQEIMRDSTLEANRVIINEVPGSGTTLTAILIVGGQITLAHVGDSRAYRISNDGAMQALTRDHSLVMRMIELGQLTVEEAAIHPQRNVLYRALGQGEPFTPDVQTSPLPDSGYFLICSDGLWGVVPEDLIAHIVTTTPNLQEASQLLVDMANEAGGPDNISVVIIRLPD